MLKKKNSVKNSRWQSGGLRAAPGAGRGSEGGGSERKRTLREEDSERRRTLRGGL
jgi:hypothetical protein